MTFRAGLGSALVGLFTTLEYHSFGPNCVSPKPKTFFGLSPKHSFGPEYSKTESSFGYLMAKVTLQKNAITITKFIQVIITLASIVVLILLILRGILSTIPWVATWKQVLV